jgi:hypothetical protein
MTRKGEEDDKFLNNKNMLAGGEGKVVVERQ